jgi:hypothetical protein
MPTFAERFVRPASPADLAAIAPAPSETFAREHASPVRVRHDVRERPKDRLDSRPGAGPIGDRSAAVIRPPWRRGTWPTRTAVTG